MIGLLRLCRLYYAIPMSSILTLTIWYAAGDQIARQRTPALYATVALALIIAGGYALNDVCDRRVDGVNAPDRPIPAGQTRPSVAATCAAALMMAGLAVALLCRWQYFVCLAVVATVLLFYNLTSKHLGTGKQLIVAVLMISFYPLALALVGESDSARLPTLYAFPCWLFLTSFGYEILKDIRDIRGDRIMTAHATWIQRWPKDALTVARVALAAGGLALVVPGLVGCGWVYDAVIPGAIALALWAARLPRQPAMIVIYAEVVVVGIAALADIIILG